MQLISEEYRRLNAEMHETKPDYGVQGREHFIDIDTISQTMRTKDILDYGCGKGTLAMHFPFTIKQYDPAIPRYADVPDPADLVVCTDVLEHIEPEFIDNVLDHLRAVTKRTLYATICTEPAKKFLSDGRNAHLLIRTPEWWFIEIEKRFEILNYKKGEHHILVVCIPK